MGSSFGKIFRLTTWGESHGPALGVVIEGVPVRVSGQDSGRGTFSHRHSILFDYVTGRGYVSLNALATDAEERKREFRTQVRPLETKA